MLSDEATLIENAHLGDWSPEKDCYWRLTFQQPVHVEAILQSQDYIIINLDKSNLTSKLSSHQRAFNNTL